MIETKDLRRGNYVTWHFNNDSEIVENITYDHINDVNFTIVEPIKLTEPWLIRFGFHITQSPNTRKKAIKWKVELVEDEEGIFSFDSGKVYIDILYVHQLQNLYFTLVNEELI